MELDGRRSRTNWIRTGIAQLTLRLAAFFVCAGVFLAAGAGARAAEVSEEEKPGDFVTIRVEAQLEKTDREALLDRINAIRREACEEGVNNPVNGIPLTPADYVPLRWSGELEKIAELRAVESTIIQDHIRPDGTECFTAAPEGISYTMETLALCGDRRKARRPLYGPDQPGEPVCRDRRTERAVAEKCLRRRLWRGVCRSAGESCSCRRERNRRGDPGENGK